MKKQISKLAFFAMALALVFTACKKDEEVNTNPTDSTELGSVDFSAITNSAAQRTKKANSTDDVTKAIVTILKNDNSATEFTDAELNVYRIDGVIYVQKVALLVGDYKLDRFDFIDENNNIIFSTPKQGSVLADLVAAPLAIDFSIGKDVVTSVPVEVISTETYTPQDFGLASFAVSEVSILDFLLAVSAQGEDVLLAGDYSITTTGVSASNTFDAIAQNVLSVTDVADATYILTINVDGYYEYTVNVTRDDLVNLYHDAPLLIELETVISPDNVQSRLADGETPLDIYNSDNELLDSLYGKTYEGGLIASLNTTNGTGIIAAPSDQASGLWDEANLVCTALDLGGKTDWYLPSKDELNLLWENLADSDGDNSNTGTSDPNNIGGFANNDYWSSTHFDSVDVWIQSFNNGYQFNYGRGTTFNVRAVRAF